MLPHEKVLKRNVSNSADHDEKSSIKSEEPDKRQMGELVCWHLFPKPIKDSVQITPRSDHTVLAAAPWTHQLCKGVAFPLTIH